MIFSIICEEGGLFGACLVIAVFALFPVIYILLSSFKSNKEILVGGLGILPTEWHFENYIQAWKLADFGRLTFNSIFYAVVVVGGCVVTSITAGYVFARGTTRFSKVVNTMVLCSMFVSIGTLSLYPQSGQGIRAQRDAVGADYHPRVWHERDTGVYRYRLCAADIQGDRRGSAD